MPEETLFFICYPFGIYFHNCIYIAQYIKCIKFTIFYYTVKQAYNEVPRSGEFAFLKSVYNIWYRHVNIIQFAISVNSV